MDRIIFACYSSLLIMHENESASVILQKYDWLYCTVRLYAVQFSLSYTVVYWKFPRNNGVLVVMHDLVTGSAEMNHFNFNTFSALHFAIYWMWSLGINVLLNGYSIPILRVSIMKVWRVFLVKWISTFGLTRNIWTIVQIS